MAIEGGFSAQPARRRDSDITGATDIRACLGQRCPHLAHNLLFAEDNGIEASGDLSEALKRSRSGDALRGIAATFAEAVGFHTLAAEDERGTFVTVAGAGADGRHLRRWHRDGAPEANAEIVKRTHKVD
jgi:hypothetical protein